jgi:hypothetical protein
MRMLGTIVRTRKTQKEVGMSDERASRFERLKT